MKWYFSNLLSKSEIGKIVNFQLRGFNQMLEKRNIILTATEDALKYLTNKGYDPVFEQDH